MQGALLVLTLMVLGLFFASPLHNISDLSMMEEGLSSEPVAIGKLCSGPLALQENERSPLALSLERKLVLLAQSVRPDFAKEAQAFCIGLDGSSQQRVVKEGEPIFCRVRFNPSRALEAVTFAEEGGDLKMTPHLMDHRSLLLEVENEAGEVFQLNLKAPRVNVEAQELSTPLAQLKEAKWWGHDPFFSHYGGEKYKRKGMQHKLKVGSNWMFVEQGDFLTLEGESWKVVEALDQASLEAPLACVQSIDANELVLEAWDEKGFSLFETRLKQMRPTSAKINPSQLIQNPKHRTANGVSCKLGKQRWILKPGDWLLFTGKGWRRLSTKEEISSYLDQTLMGELFVVDAIDRNGLMTGHVFDLNRSSKQPFSIQVAGAAAMRGRKKK